MCGTAWHPNDIHLPAQGSEQTSLELAQLFAVGWDTLANRMPKLFPQTSAAGERVALSPDSRPERERDIFPAISSWTITHLTGRVSCVDRCVGVIFLVLHVPLLPILMALTRTEMGRGQDLRR